MRALISFIAMFVLGGFAANASAQQGEYVKVRWQVATLKEIDAVCTDGVPKIYRKGVRGCYKRSFDECTIYTSQTSEEAGLHDTLGHEVRNCFVGFVQK